MKSFPLLLVCSVFFTALLSAQNQPPQLSNLSASANWSTQTLTLHYDLTDTESDPVEISVAFSNTAGDTYLLSVPVSGDVGFPVTPGAGKTILCDLSALAAVTGPFTLRLVADDKQPFDLQALVNQVDSTRLRNDLSFVEGIRHRTSGAAHLAAVQDSLRHLFSGAGFYSGDQVFNYAGYMGHNIYGTLRGTAAAQQVVIVDAHYDTVINAPGADDNGSGTIAVMEIARLLGRYPTKKTLRCIGFDLEESGLIGSARYVQTGLPANEELLGVFNFEMIGFYSTEPNTQQAPVGFNQLFPAAYAQIEGNQFRGDFILNTGNFDSQMLGNLFANAATQYVPALKVISIYPPGNSEIAPDLRRSDHARFWDAGYQALMLTDGANFRNECYHTPQDTLEKLNFTFLSNVTRATLAAAAQMVEIQHGDFATTTFQSLVGASEPLDPCAFRITVAGSSDALFLTTTGCSLHAAQLEMFGADGRRLFGQTLESANGAEQLVPFPGTLPAGIYFVKITHAGGSTTRKILLH